MCVCVCTQVTYIPFHSVAALHCNAGRSPVNWACILLPLQGHKKFRHPYLVFLHVSLAVDHMTIVVGHMTMAAGHMTIIAAGHMTVVVDHMTRMALYSVCSGSP